MLEEEVNEKKEEGVNEKLNNNIYVYSYFLINKYK